MTDQNRVWLNEKPHSKEGHDNTATLFYQGNQVWGPHGCHDNTVDIQTALRQADPRFELRLERKSHSIEGHTRTINIRARGKMYLENHSCHENMQSMADTINGIWIASPPTGAAADE
ncbi:hypothetical protein NCS52_00428800 [Fusarium sp. LHS14.1]|nr:hypothetical protein NCS52_00428800 [Fusarium sp. LHS14.1]